MVSNTIHFRILLNNMLGAPLFAVYLLGILHPRCTGSAALVALLAGVLFGFGLCLNYNANYEGDLHRGIGVFHGGHLSRTVPEIY